MRAAIGGLAAAGLTCVAALAALGYLVLALRNWRNARRVDAAVSLTISALFHAAALFCALSLSPAPGGLQAGGAGLGVRIDDSAQTAGSGGEIVVLADPAEEGADSPELEPKPPEQPKRELLEIPPAVSATLEMPDPPPAEQEQFVPARPLNNVPTIPGAVFDGGARIMSRAETETGRGADETASRPDSGQGGAAPLGAGADQSSRGSGLAHDAGGGGGNSPGGSGIVMPAYPSESREKGEEGRVVVSFTVRADGTLADIKVVESSGYARLDEAAMEAVRKSAFTPATRFGAPVESTRKIAFVFKLEEG